MDPVNAQVAVEKAVGRDARIDIDDFGALCLGQFLNFEIGGPYPFGVFCKGCIWDQRNENAHPSGGLLEQEFEIRCHLPHRAIMNDDVICASQYEEVFGTVIPCLPHLQRYLAD